MNNTTKKLLLSAAMVGLTVAATGCAEKAQANEGQCHGVNKCKGTGDCGGKDHECGGKNSCKGKGWNKSTKEACATSGGKFVNPNAKADEHKGGDH